MWQIRSAVCTLFTFWLLSLLFIINNSWCSSQQTIVCVISAFPRSFSQIFIQPRDSKIIESNRNLSSRFNTLFSITQLNFNEFLFSADKRLCKHISDILGSTFKATLSNQYYYVKILFAVTRTCWHPSSCSISLRKLRLSVCFTVKRQ